MRARVLLSSVFKPLGVDGPDSRKESKPELMHNQLTVVQGPFSLRHFASTFGLHVIANNISAPTAVLDYPSLERFRREVRKGYDFVGIGAIAPNFLKVKRMAEEVRELSPRSKIVIGGFCAVIPGLEKMVPVDYICAGEGISFMRELLGEPPEFEFKNPYIFTESRELFGVPLFGMKNPQIVVGLGCSYGCDFCAPSHFFGKRHITFFKDGKSLYQEMLRVERRFGTLVIGFVGDDNFLLDLDRAEELRQEVVKGGKVWSLFIFASADKVREFGPEKLAEMGVHTVWMGRESKFASYSKNREADFPGLVAQLRAYGIKTILSSILFIDEHTRENIREDIEDHLAAKPAFSQFCHYGPLPGTPLFERMDREGRLLKAIPYEEWHGFKQPWFKHPVFKLKEAEEIQRKAYLEDFHRLGPSLMRYIEAEFEGWKNLKDSKKPHLRKRAEFFAGQMWKYKILLRAMELAAPTSEMSEMVREVRARVEEHFGKIDLGSEAAAGLLAASARFRELRTRWFGDAIQPRTRLTRYNWK